MLRLPTTCAPSPWLTCRWIGTFFTGAGVGDAILFVLIFHAYHLSTVVWVAGFTRSTCGRNLVPEFSHRKAWLRLPVFPQISHWQPFSFHTFPTHTRFTRVKVVLFFVLFVCLFDASDLLLRPLRYNVTPYLSQTPSPRWQRAHQYRINTEQSTQDRRWKRGAHKKRALLTGHDV